MCAVNKLDKYYTPDWLIEHQLEKTLQTIGKKNITHVIEPSAGDGAYIKFLNKIWDDVEYYDLYPEHPDIIEQDFKELRKSYKKGRLVIGNPPYGTASSLWKAFCKKSARIADYISFISPASQYNSNYYFPEGDLVYSELLNDVEYRGSDVEGGVPQKVRTCLNIYKCYDREDNDIREELIRSKVKFGREFKEGYDYYLVNLTSGPRWGTMTDGENHTDYGISVIDEEIRDKVVEFLNQFHVYRDAIMKNDVMPRITNGFFMDKLKKHLYPTRDERLEQDILFQEYKEGREYDYAIVSWGDAGKVVESKDIKIKQNTYCIKILNEDVREKVEELLPKLVGIFRALPNATISPGGSGRMTKPVFRDILKKHLYPTRDERLEQDIKIASYDKRGNYTVLQDGFISTFGGKYTTDTKSTGYSFDIKNKDRYDEILSLLKNAHTIETIKNSGRLRFSELTEYLKKHLYQDTNVYTPSWEEEYELKKSIKIEREIHSKALF